MNIIIGFNNDDRQYNIPASIIEKYPLSSIYGYVELCGADKPIIMNEIDYETFGKLYDVIMSNVNLLNVSDDILQLLEHHGLINDSLFLSQKYIKISAKIELTRVIEFLAGKINFFECKTEEDYFSYKKSFQYQKNIVPVQIICHYDALAQVKTVKAINIHDGIPIYCKSFDAEWSIEHFIDEDLGHNINMNKIRHSMFDVLNPEQVKPCRCVGNEGVQGPAGRVGNQGYVGQVGTVGAVGPGGFAGAVTTGSNNIVIGSEAYGIITTGSNGTAIGFRAAEAITTGSNNIAIGPHGMTGPPGGPSGITVRYVNKFYDANEVVYSKTVLKLLKRLHTKYSFGDIGRCILRSNHRNEIRLSILSIADIIDTSSKIISQANHTEFNNCINKTNTGFVHTNGTVSYIGLHVGFMTI